MYVSYRVYLEMIVLTLTRSVIGSANPWDPRSSKYDDVEKVWENLDILLRDSGTQATGVYKWQQSTDLPVAGTDR